MFSLYCALLTEKFEYVSLVVYLVAVVLTKLSVLAFIWHLSSRSDAKFRRIVLVTGVFIVASAFAVGMMVTFDCRPIPAAWDYLIRTRTVRGCYSMQQILVTWSVVLAVTDLWLLVLPSHLIWTLRMPKQNKIRLTIMFSLGLIATLASFFKAWVAVKSYNTWDLTWHFVPILITSHLEIVFGLVAASLPALNSWVTKLVSRSSWPTWASTSSRRILSPLSRKGWKTSGYSTEASDTMASSNQKEKMEVTVISTMKSSHMPADDDFVPHSHNQITTKCSAGSPVISLLLPPPPQYDAYDSKISRNGKAIESQMSFDLVIQHPGGEQSDPF
jgi:hypothetical protein